MEPTCPPLPEPDALERLVTVVDAAVAPKGWSRQHVLVSLEGEDDLALRELPEGAHPVDELLGFVAPASWAVIGVVTYGWAAPLSPVRPSRHGERVRARVTCLVDRSGREAVTTTLADGTVIDEPGEGRLGDVLRRCMGAPTAPPPPVTVLADVLWLEALLEAPGRIGSWAAAERLRPDQGASGTTWTRLRRLADSVEAWAGIASWMDDGLFARWILAEHGSIDELLEAITEAYPPPLAKRIRAAVTARAHEL